MPQRYTAMRDKFAADNRSNGMKPASALKAAKTKAAKIYNSTRGKSEAPLSRYD